MLNNFIYAKQKSLFEKALNNGEVLDEAIVFIEDTKEIWNHGTYFDGSTFDPSNIEASILNIIDSYATKAEIPTKLSQLENDANYITKTEVADDYLVKGNYIEDDVFENGVYIVDLNGTLHDPNTFTGTADDATGIGLVTDKGAWIVALDEWYSRSASTAWNGNTYSAWGGFGKTVTGCFMNSNQSQALLDFNGEANTDAIIAQLSGTSDGQSGYTGAPVAEYCRAYSKGYKGIGEWYLPAAGELNEIVLNKDAINTVLTKLGKNSLSKNSYSWSSSQCNSSLAWCYSWSGSYWYGNGKNSNRGVRPVAKLTVSFIISRIESLENNKADKTEIPTKVSQLENDSNYVQDDVIPENGLYIYDTDGRFILPENWNTANNSKAVGVAILTDNCQFVVAKEDVSSSYLRWGGYGTDISTLTNYTSDTDAATDFDGVNNTSKIIAAIGNSNDGHRDGTAAGDCAAYTFPNGKTGYLGAAGEWQVARQHKDELNSALTLIGGTTMKESAYWTSTEYSSRNAWGQWFASDSYLITDYKDSRNYGRAFLAIEVSKSLKERVDDLESKIKDLNTSSSGANVQAVDTGDIVEDVNVEYATTTYVDGLIGDINTILESIINGVPNIITFTVATIEYQAEEGMTWEEWVNSKYNDGTFSIAVNSVVHNYSGYLSVNKADIIEANHNYNFNFSHGGGTN